LSLETCVVTGGSRGIGAATARLAAARGYAVCINYRHHHGAAGELVSEIEREGGRALAVQADISVERDVVRLFESIDRDLGPIAALVNNAGVLEQQARVDRMDAARIGRVFATNVTGAFICAREAVKRMSSRYGGSGGAIVNVSSRGAFRGEPGQPAYGASKAGLVALGQSLARALGPRGIAVTTIAPGFVETDMAAEELAGDKGRARRAESPLGRVATPDDVAAAVLYLASPQAELASGTVLDFNGASYLRM
jgi:NAD(P)-dependent dehydrogenase (short-subunit alcohol dehydrogenase family)